MNRLLKKEYVFVFQTFEHKSALTKNICHSLPNANVIFGQKKLFKTFKCVKYFREQTYTQALEASRFNG